MTDPVVPDPEIGHLHPDCPDLARLGPNPPEAALRAMAARVELDGKKRERAWERGFTRRRFVAGAGMVGVAAFGLQTATARVSFAAPGTDRGTLVVIFLRGGTDGLSVLVPGGDADLLDARPTIAVRNPIPLDRGFGLHPALEPLMPLWRSGRFTAVPAVSTPDLSRSHFQAQDCLERGGSAGGGSNGWLDRTLAALGSGTTFRAIGYGATLPRALVGGQGALALRSIGDFTLAGWEGVHEKTKAALATLYTGFEHPVAQQASATLSALAEAERIATSPYEPAATYPEGGFGSSLADIARLVKARVGLRVACVDLGGWDMHTKLGTVDDGDMKDMLGRLGAGLGAFATDLGDELDNVTVVAMTEFGRRVEENANRGADHGHGAVAMLMGGGLAGGRIPGAWPGLAPDARDNGDVAGANDYRDLLSEVLTSRFGLGADALGTIFPGHRPEKIGAMR